MPTLELKNVSYVYNKGTTYETKALKNINLTIGKGITGIIGHTGSGKSTLVQLFNGLLKPTEGEVLINGENIWKNKETVRKARFAAGLVMQYPEYQLFASSVREDIAFGPGNMGLDKEEIDKRVEESARLVDVPESIMERSPFDISGGQKRRVAFAGVISMEPEFLVLDEPAAGLDPGGRRSILGGLQEYCEVSGKSVVIVSHSMEDMASYCDRVIVLTNGEIIMDGVPSEIFSRAEELRSVGLDVPQVTAIAEELCALGLDIGLDVYTVDYAVKKIIEKAGL